MKKYSFLVLILFFFAFEKRTLLAQQDRFTTAELKEDLAHLYQSIVDIHPDPYTFVDSIAYTGIYDSLSSELSEMSKTEFLFHLAPLLTCTEDGHLNVSFAKKRFLGGRFGRKKRMRETLKLPLAIRKIEDEFLVAGNLSLDTIHFKRGTKILAIDDRPIDTLVQQLGQFSGGADGPAPEGRAYWTLRFLSTRYLHFFGATDSFSLTVIPQGDTTIQQVKIAALSVLEINQIAAKRYKGKKASLIDFTMLSDTTKTGRLAIRSFTYPKDFYSWRFSRKLKKAFKAIKKQEVKTLVIDLRGNGGGALSNAALVGRYLMPEPFRLGKEVKVNPGVHKNKQVNCSNRFNLWLRFKYRTGAFLKRKNAIRLFKPKKKWNYAGPVDLLTDAGSFSATANLVAKLKSENRVNIVGEPTGGGYFMDFGGFFQYITLPNTRLRFRIPLIQYINKVNPSANAAKEILPHHYLQRSKQDFLDKKDTVIKFILKE